MTDFCYTLLPDGPTDAALLPILTFLLRENGVRSAIQPLFADLRNLAHPPKRLEERIAEALYLNDTDLLFVHRDAEKVEGALRRQEISTATDKAQGAITASRKSSKEKTSLAPPVVCVIPIRMTEAWLFSSETALRTAAGNPNGKMILTIPPPKTVEQIPDPKEVLHQLLRTASGYTGRRLHQFSTRKSSHRVAELTDDFSALRGIPAFDAIEADIAEIVQTQKWNTEPENEK